MVKTFVSALAVIFTISSVAAAKPRNYDECILDNISNAQTNAAVTAVRQACRSLFPLPKFDPTKPFTIVGEVEKEILPKKFFLTSLEKGRTSNFINLEIINDTDHLIADVYIRYKEKSCEMPTSAAVAQAQKILNRQGYRAGKVDGKFGSKTSTAVKLFQKRMDLAVTGKLDDQTLEVLGIDTEIGWLTQGPAQQKLWIAPGASKRYKFYLPNPKICFHAFGYANM